MKLLLTFIFSIFFSSFALAENEDNINSREKRQERNLQLNNYQVSDPRDNLFAFGLGFLGQTYGLVGAAMDGSANSSKTRKYATIGFVTGLATWTAVAISTSVVIVPVIYTTIYIAPPTYWLISSSLANKSKKRQQNTAKEFQTSNTAVLLQDSINLFQVNKIVYNTLPRQIKRDISQSQKDSVINVYRLKLNNLTLFGIETRQPFGMTYNYSQESGNWITETQHGWRIQYYNKKGVYLMTQWLKGS